MPYNVFSQTDTLKHVMLGTWFYPEFFDCVKNKKIREPLKQVCHEINEDLDIFESNLKQAGVTVMRPNQIVGSFDKENPVSPPMAVRDTHHIIGDTCYNLGAPGADHDYGRTVYDVLIEYNNKYVDLHNVLDYYYRTTKKASNKNECKDILYSREKYDVLKGSSWPEYEDYINDDYKVSADIKKEMDDYHVSLRYRNGFQIIEGPNIILSDTMVIIDHNEYSDYINIIKQYVNHPDIVSKEWKHINTQAGHTDGCFVFLNPDTVVGIPDLIDYKGIFGVKNVIGIPWKNYQSQVEEFVIMRKKNSGKYWLKGEETNDELIYFINDYLDNVVGYCEETVFDVNLLCLDHKHVFVNSNNKDFHKMIKNTGVEPIYSPWRHRFFVDSGLHCITLDIERY